jgi:tetratricopeptide (TPR) repeat protein
VLRAGGPARLLVMATFRDTEVGPAHPLSAVLADLRRRSGVERISLEGLSVDELAELLGDIPRGQAARTLAAALHEGTEGNPFFVEVVLRDVAESGLAVGALRVPEGVREVIVSRVARLPAPTRELLGVASVLGRNLELAPVSGVAGLSEEGAAMAMEEALAARLVEETEVGAYRFVHALVRSALYDTLSATRRAQIHLRAAEVTEQQDPEDAARLAHHLVACAPLGEPTRTARACLAAGDRALAVLADYEAGDWYSKGLAFGEEDPTLRIDLLTGLGESQRRTGDAASRQTLLDAARSAADHGDVGRLARAVLANNRGISSMIGHVDEERLEVIDTALDLVGPAPSRDRAELLVLQAAELLFAGDHKRVLRAADEAGAIADRLDDVAVRARVGLQRLWACLIPDRITVLASEGVEVVRLADSSGDPQLRAWSRAMWGCSLLLIGDLGRARQQAMETMAVADEAGQPGLRALAHSFYATALDALGEHEEAQRLAQAVPELGQQAGWPDAMLWYVGLMLLPWVFEGQSEVAVAVASSAAAGYPRMAIGPAALALCLAFAGRGEELAGLLAGVPSVLPEVPVDLYWLGAHAAYAGAQEFGVENADAAAATYDALLPYRAFHIAAGISLYVGPIEMALAVLSRVMGDVEGALAHHEAASATIEACGAARARAMNGYGWAMTLLARDAPGNRRRAADMLEDTLAYSRTKGYTTFVDKTEELLATIT